MSTGKKNVICFKCLRFSAKMCFLGSDELGGWATPAEPRASGTT